MNVQRLARVTMRRHLARASGRVVTLLFSDLAAFAVARAVIRAVRDSAIFGPGVAGVLAAAIPRGFLGGWAFATALLAGLVVTGSYGRGDRRRDTGRLFMAVALAASLSLWAPLWEQGLQAVAIQFLATATCVWAALALERWGIEALVRGLVPPEHQAERVLFVGDPRDPVGSKLYDRLVSRGEMVSVGWVSRNGQVQGNGVLGSVWDFWDVIHATRPDTVILCGHLPDQEFESVVSGTISAGCRLLSVPRYDGLAELRPGLVWQRGLPMVELTVPSLKARQLLVKRVIDLLGSAVGLVLLSPVFLVVAIAIKLDSEGPVFFAQERVGLGGRVFRMLKFRTMRNGADAEKQKMAHLNHTGDPRLFKIPNDPRVTRVGAWLRRWSVDELPQLWNVFAGHMSLVGPRPFFEADLAGYADHHVIRLGAKPGITGLWQVNGRSSIVDFEEVVRLDREYVDFWSLWLDFKILGRTLPAVLTRSGAF